MSAQVEARLRQLEGRALGKISGSARGKSNIDSYDKDRKAETPGLVSAAKVLNVSVGDLFWIQVFLVSMRNLSCGCLDFAMSDLELLLWKLYLVDMVWIAFV